VIESREEFLAFLAFLSLSQLSAAEFYSEIGEEQLDLWSLNYRIVALHHDKNVKLAIKRLLISQ